MTSQVQLVRLNARIHNQREQLAHKEFVLNQLRSESIETLTAIDQLLFLALTLPDVGQRIAAIEAAQGITTTALDAQGIEARQRHDREAGHGRDDESPVPEGNAPND